MRPLMVPHFELPLSLSALAASSLAARTVPETSTGGGSAGRDVQATRVTRRPTPTTMVRFRMLLSSSSGHGPLPVDRHLGRFGENHQDVAGGPRLLQGGGLRRRADKVL